MQLQRERDTQPELALRQALHRRGLRYRVDFQGVAGTRRRIDIAFTKAKIAVFVDGCFWHGCPEHGKRDHEINGWYWPGKIQTNKARDSDTDLRLAKAGWRVIRVWEHQAMEDVVPAIEALLRS
jgi:DNA mismatch endonuclease (patch repair protein)